jgi:hypothetical protein
LPKPPPMSPASPPRPPSASMSDAETEPHTHVPQEEAGSTTLAHAFVNAAEDFKSLFNADGTWRDAEDARYMHELCSASTAFENARHVYEYAEKLELSPLVMNTKGGLVRIRKNHAKAVGFNLAGRMMYLHNARWGKGRAPPLISKKRGKVDTLTREFVTGWDSAERDFKQDPHDLFAPTRGALPPLTPLTNVVYEW